MSTEFKDKVKKEAEEDEQEKILIGCKRGVRHFKEKLDEAKENLAHAQNMYNVFLNQVESDPKKASVRISRREEEE